MLSGLPIEILLGVYLGLLTGIVPALAAGGLGFVVKYFTGVSLPGFGVVVLALSIASINGGLLGLLEPEIVQSPRLLIAVVVVLMLSLYAHSQGDRLATEFPRRLSLSTLRKQTLSADAVEFVGGIGQVVVRPTGAVRDLEGYPPLSPEIRSAISGGAWRFPADVPLIELERRLEDRLRSEYDLAAVQATVDERGKATIAAAPPLSGLSRRIPTGKRAVSVDALLPAGLARGDEVTVYTTNGTVTGSVLSVQADEDVTDPVPADEEGDAVEDSVAGPTGAAGGEGRVTVVVGRADAAVLLSATRGEVIVQSRGTSSEFVAISTLRKAGVGIRRVTLGAPLSGGWRARDIAILAARSPSPEGDTTVQRRRRWRRTVRETDDRRWWFAPTIPETLPEGAELFVAGTDGAIDRLEEAVDQ